MSCRLGFAPGDVSVLFLLGIIPIDQGKGCCSSLWVIIPFDQDSRGRGTSRDVIIPFNQGGGLSWLTLRDYPFCSGSRMGSVVILFKHK